MKRVWLAGSIALLVLLATPSLTIVARQIEPLGDAASSRQECLRDCREWLEPFGGRGGRGGWQQGRIYARCVAECERKFWKEWDREMQDL